MAEHSEQEDAVSISIREMLWFVQKSPDQPCISKVPYYLRKVREEAYEPQVISVGPYHHGKPPLQAMEQLKIRFLQKLLEERNENDVSVYVSEIRKVEDEARKCYTADPDRRDLGSDEFVKMLLLDGVFLVQMIRLNLDAVPIYLRLMVNGYSAGLIVGLHQDMLLVENQLPYFVLWKLFCMIESWTEDDQEYKFRKAIFRMLRPAVPGKERPEADLQSLGSDFKHLLDFTYHCCWHPSTSEKKAPEDSPLRREEADSRKPRDDRKSSRLYIKNLLSSWYNYCCHPSTSDPETENNQLKFIPCVTQLREAGIKFKLFEEGKTMFDMKFENGTLHIPQIKIADYAERFLRNLIAYEQIMFRAGAVHAMHATDYMIFMDYLVDSPKDVEILRQAGIIVNMLGDDKAVKTMINGLGVFVIYSSSNFYYTEIFKEVNRHRNRRWNRWMASLKHNYFNSPWASISVLGAALLLVLTLLQTVFSAIF